MGFLSEETKRRKKRFSGDLVSFMKRHGLSGVATAKLLGVGENTVSTWVTRRSGPYLSDIEPLRQKMKEHDERNPSIKIAGGDPCEPSAIRVRGGTGGNEEVRAVRPLLVTGQHAGVKLTLEGGDGDKTKIHFEAQITMDTAREIIRLYAERS